MSIKQSFVGATSNLFAAFHDTSTPLSLTFSVLSTYLPSTGETQNIYGTVVFNGFQVANKKELETNAVETYKEYLVNTSDIRTSMPFKTSDFITIADEEYGISVVETTDYTTRLGLTKTRRGR